MKCIARLYGLAGGAPRSVLQHLKVLQIIGYNEIKCLAHNSDNYLKQEYESIGCEIIERKSCAELWDSSKYLEMYYEYRWEFEWIKNEQPDLIIALGEINGALYSYFCNQLGIPLLIYIPGGQLTTHEMVMDLWGNCEIICFSQENYDCIKLHVDIHRINTISNRISINNCFTDLNEHYNKDNKSINILIPSRISGDKIKSLKSTLMLLEKCAKKEMIINVHIAGRGARYDELNAFCNTLSNKYLNVSLLGHKDDLIEEFRWAHIVAGKGRSVIEPIMMYRIGCIIGEEGDIAFCNENNFNNLYHYNFAGRCLEKNDPICLMTEMCQNISNGKIQEENIMTISKIVQKYYSSDYLLEKLQIVIKKLPVQSRKIGPVLLWTQFFRLIVKKFQGKIKNRYV